MNDDDKRLLPLFECFEQVIHALGEQFVEPHISLIFERCTRILRGILDAVRADPKDGWTQTTPFFLRATELISVVLMTVSDEKSAQLIAH